MKIFLYCTEIDFCVSFITDKIPITDNDSLAARISVEIGADLAIMMSDIDGVYKTPPSSKSDDDNRILHTFIPSDLEMVRFGEKSTVGTGGMESKVLSNMRIPLGRIIYTCIFLINFISFFINAIKVRSAMWALENGTSVVICNGTKNTRNNIRKVVAGQRIGTFFSLDTLENFGQPVEVLAQNGKLDMICCLEYIIIRNH